MEFEGTHSATLFAPWRATDAAQMGRGEHPHGPGPLSSAPSRHLLSAVGSSEHPAGVDQRPPTEVALRHEGGQCQRGLQGSLPWVLARRALKASVDPLDFSLCYLSLPARVKARKLGQGLYRVGNVCGTQERQITPFTLPSGPQKDLVRGMTPSLAIWRVSRAKRWVHTG